MKGGKSKGWIKAISRGGLFTPSPALVVEAKKWEKEFKNCHGEQLNSEKNPMMNLARILYEISPTVPREIVDLYSRTRFFIRLKHLNAIPKIVHHVSKFKY